MIMKELIALLNELAPESYAESWDNSGLQVGRIEREVHKVFLALDLTGEALQRAIEAGCDTIITHHPLIFSPQKRITGDDLLGRRILSLAEHKINCYAMHTNFDAAVMGKLCAERLGLSVLSPLEVTVEGTEGPEGSVGIGTISAAGAAKEESILLRELAVRVREAFQLQGVRVYGDPETQVHCIAMCPGAGKSLVGLALQSGAQVYITGDIDHHTALDCLEDGLCIIDAGHHGLEHIFVDYMKAWFAAHTENIEIVTDPNDSPFTVI